MEGIGTPAFTTALIKPIEERIKRQLGNNAYTKVLYGTVANYSPTTATSAVYLFGQNQTASEGFKVRSGFSPVAGDKVVVCIRGQERWIESILRGVTRAKFEAYPTAGYVDLSEIAAPATPATGIRRIYAKTTGVFSKDQNGVETQLDGGTGGGSTKQISYPDSPASTLEYLARIKLNADTEYRATLGLDASGQAHLLMGAGTTAPPDLRLVRTAAGWLQIDSNSAANETRLNLRATAGQNNLLSITNTGDSFSRLLLEGDAAAAAVAFGPGSAAQDLRMRRSGTKTLTIDDNAGGSATVNVVGTLQQGGTGVSLSGHTHTSTLVGVKAVRTATQAITTATDTDILFTAADEWDTDGFHDPASNSDRITIPAGKGGKYLIVANCEFPVNGTGQRKLTITVNGGSAIGGINTAAAPNLSHRCSVTVEAQLAAGDIVRANVRQNSGGNLNVELASLSVRKFD